jgi:aldehyde dehydrogenase (NAD+)
MDWPGKSLLYPEPKGLALIIGPWNYPFLLIMSPLIGALAAGNCVVLKPSEFAPNTGKILEKLIRECFPDEYCCVVQGDAYIGQQLLDNPWGHIFFTGSTSIGKHIMKSAAQYLSPVTLELGGKNPCIVMEDSDISISAERIVWGKFLNAGQTCVAPDYLLVHKNIEKQLIAVLKKNIHRFYGSDPQTSPDYARIVNHRHFDRLISCLEGVKILFGGHHDRDDLYIEPTLISDIRSNKSLIQEEIFGPILPVLTFDNVEEVIKDLQTRPKPLALYLFTKNRFWQERICARLSSGSLAFNETISQIGNLNLPFGGVGESGMGAYHGRSSFDCFSHYKGVLIKGYQYHNRLRYPPYKMSLPQLKKIFKIIIK